MKKPLTAEEIIQRVIDDMVRRDLEKLRLRDLKRLSEKNEKPTQTSQKA